MFDLKGLGCAWLRLWESCAAIKDKNSLFGACLLAGLVGPSLPTQWEMRRAMRAARSSMSARRAICATQCAGMSAMP